MSEKKFDPFADDKVMTHPSFVAVSFHRITGQRRFFGSSVESQTWIELQVCPAELHHHLGYDSIHAHNRPIIEVALSPAQFAELLTTMNSGPGVPGTLQTFDGKDVEQLPDIEGETSRVREEFAKSMARKADEYIEVVKSLEKKLAEKKSLNKTDATEMLSTLNSLVMQFKSNMPFYLDQFNEAAEKVATQHKAEVDAFISHAVQKTGLEALRSQTPQIEKKKDET